MPMRIITIRRIFGITLVFTAVAATGLEAGAKHSSRAVLLEWNQLLQNTSPSRVIPGRHGSTR